MRGALPTADEGCFGRDVMVNHGWQGIQQADPEGEDHDVTKHGPADQPAVAGQVVQDEGGDFDLG